jgi:phosphoribosyl 1,2-cyclic phosphodiesterase
LKARLWGTRGSIAAAGPATIRYGGDTSAVEVRTAGGQFLILDAGSGLRPIDTTGAPGRIDILLSHLHMDHVQGLPFFAPMLDPDFEVHVWGPISTTRTLRDRLSRYMSPPLFPVRVRDLKNVVFHDVVPGRFEIGSVEVRADLICHPGSTLGYRLTEDERVLAYLPDHEPAFGSRDFPGPREWTSGFDIASGANVMIHDAQYDDTEYESRVGWGHSSMTHLAVFAEVTGVERVVTFHHDPAHTDDDLDVLHDRLEQVSDGVVVVRGKTGLTLEV